MTKGIPNEVLKAIEQDIELKSKQTKHIQRTNTWGIYLKFMQSIYPAIINYSKIFIIWLIFVKIYPEINLSSIIKVITDRDNNYIIICFLFILALFSLIKNKYK